MNYIIVSDSVVKELEEQFESYCEEYGYTATFDSYMFDVFSFNGVFKLYNRYWNETTYSLIGKQCSIYLEEHKRLHNCFYAKGMKFFNTDSEYLSKLAQTVELPGEWNVITITESYDIDDFDTEDITDIVSVLKPSYREYFEFEDKWKTWDLYNTKLKEAEEQQEIETECIVKHVLVENNIFIIQLESWSKQYVEGVDICVRLAEESKFQLLGKIVSVDVNNQKLRICCEKHDFIKRYVSNQIGKITKVRIIDFGTLTRLKRQRDAMKKLFQEETANSNLKDIIMGEYDFTHSMKNALSMKDAYGLFGSNIRQKEAYLGALNAQDIYLIQGPPGTGKTTIITEIVKHVIEQNMTVLVSSETNTAVDNVLERIQYMDRVIPVRLGSEERIEEACISYMPDKIADSILNSSKKKIMTLGSNSIDLDSLISECEIDWKHKIQHVDKEINKLSSGIPTEYEYTKLYNMIDDYEKLIIETNELYMEIMAEQKKYRSLKERQIDYLSKKHEMEALIETTESSIMKSGLAEADTVLKVDIRQLSNALLQVNNELKKVEDALYWNTFETKKGTYQRKIRKVEREKQKFGKLLKQGTSFLATLHTMKNAISDIIILKEQKARYEQCLMEDIEKIRADYVHKQELWNKSSDIRSEWLDVLEDIETRKVIENIYMKKANVVFTTCAGIASTNNGSFANMDYDYVIIDEAAKCNILDLLIPLVRGKKIILVGDHKQLYPMFDTESIKDEMTKEQIDMLKEHILFKWLYEERVPEECKTMLNRQYRMQNDISEFISSNFYDNGLICEKEKNNSEVMMWIDCEKSKEISNGTSYENTAEAELIVQLVKKLDSEYENGVRVGIICTYKAQARRIQGMLNDITLINLDVECSTVDAFQGKEKHTIIFNTVRNEKISRFIADENRVNVAVSRAQEYLYVVGKTELMKSIEAGVLGKLYEYIKLHGEVRNSRYVR